MEIYIAYTEQFFQAFQFFLMTDYFCGLKIECVSVRDSFFFGRGAIPTLIWGVQEGKPNIPINIIATGYFSDPMTVILFAGKGANSPSFPLVILSP